jgi:hypothetical protein
MITSAGVSGLAVAFVKTAQATVTYCHHAVVDIPAPVGLPILVVMDIAGALFLAGVLLAMKFAMPRDRTVISCI